MQTESLISDEKYKDKKNIKIKRKINRREKVVAAEMSFPQIWNR